MKAGQMRARHWGRALGLLGTFGVALGAARGVDGSVSDAVVPTDSLPPTAALSTTISDSLFGLSGKLRVRLLHEQQGTLAIPVLSQLFGDSAAKQPGIYDIPDTLAGRPFSVITMLPFRTKSGERIGQYRIGFWPAERRNVSSAGYSNPDGFIVVTKENQDTRISEHFLLRDFLTKDQRDVWPKYLVLRLELVDKLELVIDELKKEQIEVTRLAVMSGFRTPQYNANGGNPRGRATLSRHMFGDAADVFVDNDGNGRMDDLNRDGRVDQRDLAILLAAVERVERAHPTLVGGLGRYRSNRSHGPFAHIDVRGSRARWGS